MFIIAELGYEEYKKYFFWRILVQIFTYTITKIQMPTIILVTQPVLYVIIMLLCMYGLRWRVLLKITNE